ncbi:MAG: hypothetical protein NZ480_09905, partial [Bdellovibrionaceae bacterium]|nr:hypothetical protein [Pseudobdellovibrionaceae bacterium]MDW8191009.1 hypothetical protein [Pseudobdellovibrionaceae bacterium]
MSGSRLSFLHAPPPPFVGSDYMVAGWVKKKELQVPTRYLSPIESIKLMANLLKEGRFREINPAFSGADALEKVGADLQKLNELNFVVHFYLSPQNDGKSQTQWKDGVLWVKIFVNGDQEPSDPITKEFVIIGWIPYFESKTNRPVIRWEPRERIIVLLPLRCGAVGSTKV